jgi:hypothetical protein
MSAGVLSLVVLLPIVGNAQAPTLVGSSPPLQFGSAQPEVTAAAAAWQVNGEAIVVQGLAYSPTRQFRMFDGNVMTQIGIYERVPIYADATVEPFTVVYVPVGGTTMRAYEHSPGQLAATIRMPAVTPSVVPTVVVVPQPTAVGTAGTTVPAAVGTGGSYVTTRPSRSITTTSSRRRAPLVLTALQPSGRNGIWLEFAGSRYYNDGAAAVFSEDRFTKIGEYRGFPVYRAVDDVKKDRIWVTLAHDGPVAPFSK